MAVFPDGRPGMVRVLKANPGRIALAVGLLSVLAVVFAVLQGGEQPSRPDKVRFVCVATGKTFWLERGAEKILPRKNPQTGQQTLLPCHEGEDGRLYVSSRCRSLVKELAKESVNQYVDPETLLVRSNP